MAITNILASNSINKTVGDGISLASGDLLNIFEGGYVLTNAAGMTGVVMAGNSQVMVHGQVFGPNMGIFAQGTGSWRQSITIGESGIVSGQQNGIRAQGGDANPHILQIQNAGQIIASASDTAGPARATVFGDAVTLLLLNSGTISDHLGSGYAIRLTNGRGLDLTNTGLIGGAVRVQNSSTDDIALENLGVIAGGVDLSSTTANGDVVFANHGTIKGNVALVGNMASVTLDQGIQRALDILADTITISGQQARIKGDLFVLPVGAFAGSQVTAQDLQGSRIGNINSGAEFNNLDLSGAQVASFMAGGTSFTTLTLDGARIGTISTGNGGDLIDASLALRVGLALLGGGNDTYLGGAAVDVVRDWLGDDSISLGAGDDRIEIEAGDKLQSDNDIYDGGLGTDWIDAFIIDAGLAPDGGLYISLEEGIIADRLPATAYSVGRDLISGFENVKGSELADEIIGDAKANVLQGNLGADLLFGNGGSDTLRGGGGLDWLQGGAGRDVMTGGSEMDAFVYEKESDSGPSRATRDVITDFVVGLDYIQLGAIDAQTTIAGNGIFTFLGNATSGGIGTVRYSHVHGDTLIEANTDTDNASEFSLLLRGIHVLQASDFVL